MPAQIGQFIAYVGYAIYTGLTSIGLSNAAALFVLDVGIKLAGLSFLNFVYNKIAGVPDFAVSAQATTVTIRGTLEHQRIIYGETIASGPIWYINAAGTHNQALHYGIMLAGHEIEDITDMWINDNRIPEAAIDWAGNGSVDSGDYAGNTAAQAALYFDKFLGTVDQTASPDLIASFSEITSAHQGQHIAWVLARCDYFEGQTQVWSAGAPDNIRALVKGKKVYNPNSDSTTAWGTGPHRTTNSGTWEYSNNAALCWADYMIDDRLGFGEAPSRINYGYVASAAAVCSGVVFTPVGTSHRFTCDGVLSTGDTYEDNLQKILSSFNGKQAFINGQWIVKAWMHETPTLQFTEDDLRDDLQIKLGPDEDQRYNTVRGYLIDKDRLWKSSQFPEFTSSEYVSRDNDKVLYRDIQLHMTKDVYMAQRLAAGVLEQSDLTTTIIMPTNFKTLPVEVGGTIKVSNNKMGWVGQEFSVEKYKFKDLGGIDIVARINDSTAYTDVGTAEYTVSSQGSYVTANPGIPAPSSMALLAAANDVIINVTPPPARLFETIEIYAAPSTEVLSNAVLIYEGASYRYVHKLDYPGLFQYWTRAKNYVGEYSTFLPNSNSQGYSVTLAAFDSKEDLSFEKSSDIERFWTMSYVGSFGEIEEGSGVNGGNAARLEAPSLIGFNAARHRPLRVFDTEFFGRCRYRVNTYYGPSVQDSGYLFLGPYSWTVNTYYATRGPEEPQIINPAGGTFIYQSDVVGGPNTMVASLNLTGSWDTISHTVAITSAWATGYKHGGVGVGVSVWNTNSDFIEVYIDAVAYRFQ